MSEKEWPTLGFSVKGNRYEIKATRGEIYEAYTDDQIIELVDRRAIAAKDARIAELEGLLREMDSGWDLPPYFQHCIEQLLRDSSRFTWDLQNPESLRTRIDDALSTQQQADPVMQVSSEVSKQISKRGRDAIMAAERLVTLDESKTVSLEDMESRFGVEPATHPEDGRECQHQRTHYSQRNGGEHVCSNCGESANDAQPARQVGDVQLTGEYHADVNMLLERIPRQVGGGEMEAYLSYVKLHTDWLIGTSTENGWSFIDADTEQGWRIWQARAALAPAAVAVDSSASLINALEQVRTMVGNDEYADDVIGFINRSIYNHARLNRRAIPAGLLEKAADLLKSYQQVIDGCHSSEIERFDYQPEVQGTADELRALLGKS